MMRPVRICMMPGCENEVESGRLCDACKSGGRDYQFPIIGVSPEVQPHLRPKKKPVWNRKPRETRTCACGCGQKFRVKVDSKRRYFDVHCMHRHKPGTKPEKYPISSEIDQQIIEVYQTKVGFASCRISGPVAELAQKTGLPRWKITRRAAQLGLIQRSREAYRAWAEEELQIIRANAQFSHITIQRKLKAAGFARSETAVKVKLTRMGGCSLIEGHYSAAVVAEKFGVDVRSVARWIHKGFLPARLKGTSRTDQQGGDAYVIARDDLRRFVVDMVSIIDFRKINKWWVVELLTGKVGEK